MTAAPPDDLDQLLRVRLAELRRNKLEEIGEEPLAWLAVAPVWTERLAAFAEYPTGAVSLSEYLERAERRGLVVRGRDAVTEASRELVPILLRLAPFLDEQQLEFALAKVIAIPDAAGRSQALVRLTPYLPDQALAQAVAGARAFADVADRAPVLGALSQRLPSPDREILVQEVVAAAEGLSDHVTRARVLFGVWPDLTKEQRSALANYVIGEVATSGSRGRGLLQTLVPLMPPQALGPLAAELLSHQDLSIEAAGFSVLAAKLAEPQRSSLLSAASDVASSHADRDFESGL